MQSKDEPASARTTTAAAKKAERTPAGELRTLRGGGQLSSLGIVVDPCCAELESIAYLSCSRAFLEIVALLAVQVSEISPLGSRV